VREFVGTAFHIIDSVFIGIDKDERMFTKLNSSADV